MEYKKIFHRLFWFAVYVILISYTTFIIITLWGRFITHPTVTTLVSSTYPVSQVPFPGISICNLNKISKRRAREMANDLGKTSGRDPEDLMTYLHHLGQLYDFDFQPESVSRLLQFQNFLDRMHLTVIDLTKRLATPCAELLESCVWKNVATNCSKIFSLQLTHDGYCCVFNYAKFSGKAFRTDAGLENGLHVLVKNDVWDYSYTTLSTIAVAVQVFVPTDYPDKASGALTQLLTRTNAINFIEIVPTTLTSSRDVADYPVDKRECLLDNERKTILDEAYSQSDCYVDCRLISIQAMCQCIPFMIPVSNSSTVCTLADLPCLNRYRDKWFALYPEGESANYLEREKQDSLRCDQKCYASCEETTYDVSFNLLPVFRLDNETKQDNKTQIHLYYSNRFSNHYRQDVIYYWFELLSNFGGIFGICLGLSVVSMLQLLMHYCRKFVLKLII